MSVTEIKEQLHHTIDSIEDEKLLEAVLIILTSQSESHNYPLTEEQIQVLEERHERFINGEEKTSTLEEFKEKMRKKYGF